MGAGVRIPACAGMTGRRRREWRGLAGAGGLQAADEVARAADFGFGGGAFGGARIDFQLRL